MLKKLYYLIPKLILILVLTGILSCDDDSELPTFALHGNILNTTLRNVKNATVELYKENETSAAFRTITNNLGEYSFDGVESGNYILKAMANGYNLTSEYVELSNDRSRDVTILGDANVLGRIINSQTGGGLSGATVSFSFDLSATTSDNAELQVTTDYDGYFRIEDGPVGNVISIIEADGFFPRKIDNITFGVGDNSLDDQTIVEEPDEGSIRIVLSWGANPYDLDSHLTGPTETDRFHVYFGEQNYGSDVNLDVDDTYSYGPETITIYNFYPGTYRYSVHNYSNQTTSGGMEIAQSPTKVEVYDYSGLQATYSAPSFSGYGNTWRVFEINVAGTTANINPINTYVQAESYGDMDTFKNNEEKESVTFDLNNF